MSIQRVCFLWRNKKNISAFCVKKVSYLSFETDSKGPDQTAQMLSTYAVKASFQMVYL